MDDLISRQAAIDGAKRLSLGETDATRLAMRIGDYLERLQSAQQWIPCSERLPDEEDTYQVMLDKSNLLDDEAQVIDAYWIDNQWQYGVLESYEHRMPKLVVEPIEELKVIAWMPFPEPWKGAETC